jgi:pimeloyl-ACP methyl ester carboxylesterase
MAMMRIRVMLLAMVAVAVSLASGPSIAQSGIVRERVSFSVTNTLSPGQTFTIRGELIRPRAGCSRSVLLAMHGLSYGAWAWDFPINPNTYSVAQALAARGYALLTVDELGYNSSAGAGSPDHPNGYTINVFGYADMAAQMITQLRAGTYHASSPVAFGHVGLIGHSAGSEIIELATALNPGLVDVMIATGYTHEPFVNNEWLVREWTQDNIRAAQSDYEYFETDPATRAADMHNLANTAPNVVAWDNAHAALTPSGEIFSIGGQLSRFLLPTIRIPVLIVLAEKDELFPASNGPNEMLWFQGTSDKSLVVAPNAGHAFMLERNAPVTNTAIAKWLQAHPAQLPTC